ncbi:metallophosphoesterase family protein [Ramlibacter sp. AN1015]|uniref:metallophosphoesterase family protein n=1 Tax=Ramlibacter sp. AN1015 TaxID=3133428 RepID=UPI0030C335D4
MTSSRYRRIGLISDTHKLLRPQALDFLRGCELIVHAGDLVTPDALDELGALAPVVAVRGNNDRGDWARALPETARVRIGEVELLVVHDLATLAKDEPLGEGVRVVVSGHSHKPGVEERGGVLFVNPGSAGPRRFSLPISAGELLIGPGGAVDARIVQLVPPAGA